MPHAATQYRTAGHGQRGTNRIVASAHRIIEAWESIKASPMPVGRRPKLWDGRAAERIVEILRRDFEAKATAQKFGRVEASVMLQHRQMAGKLTG